MNYKVIIFDFFGVISSEVAPFWFEKHFAKEEAISLKHEHARPADLGEITDEEYFQKMSGLVSKTPETIRNEWLELATINTDVVALIKSLRGTYKIALCSNAPSAFLRKILEDNELISLFDTIVISSEVNIAKPDPAIFELVLEQIGSRPEEAIFIDDNPKNAQVATDMGIRSFVFLEHTQLKNELVSAGVL